ncbi:MAG: hypothetical protein KatS3mg096_578 [Candidatus Parcubacteria bacterium]|nr:MAG: hypothetical protein KatS3mg096_578 [Candidatus Parcubacteria bacterium]
MKSITNNILKIIFIGALIYLGYSFYMKKQEEELDALLDGDDDGDLGSSNSQTKNDYFLDYDQDDNTGLYIYKDEKYSWAGVPITSSNNYPILDINTDKINAVSEYMIGKGLFENNYGKGNFDSWSGNLDFIQKLFITEVIPNMKQFPEYGGWIWDKEKSMYYEMYKYKNMPCYYDTETINYLKTKGLTEYKKVNQFIYVPVKDFNRVKEITKSTILTTRQNFNSLGSYYYDINEQVFVGNVSDAAYVCLSIGRFLGWGYKTKFIRVFKYQINTQKQTQQIRNVYSDMKNPQHGVISGMINQLNTSTNTNMTYTESETNIPYTYLVSPSFPNVNEESLRSLIFLGKNYAYPSKLTELPNYAKSLSEWYAENPDTETAPPEGLFDKDSSFMTVAQIKQTLTGLIRNRNIFDQNCGYIIAMMNIIFGMKLFPRYYDAQLLINKNAKCKQLPSVGDPNISSADRLKQIGRTFAGRVQKTTVSQRIG